MSLIARLNHQLTRLDTLEHTRGPARRWLLPLTALGFTGALLYKNRENAAPNHTQSQTLLRDGLIIGGTLTGLLLGNAFSRSAGKTLARRLSAEAAEHAHHAAESITGITTKLGQWLGQRYSLDKHSHAAEGFIALESLALSSILGGGLGGIAADKLNNRDIRKSAPMKLKEGIFQFVGNITICTAAIVAGGALGKRLFAQIAKVGFMERFNTNRLLKQLVKQGQQAEPSLKQLPTRLTAQLEEAILNLKHHQGNPDAFKAAMAELAHTHLGHEEEAACIRFVEGLDRQNFKGLRDEINRYFLNQIHPEYQAMGKAAELTGLSEDLQADITAVGQHRFQKRGEWLGTILGLGGGVVGGAWTANHFNKWLSKTFNLPEGHADVHLFSPAKPGIGEGKLGDRGLHWWDMMTHIDDVPSALYIGGVHLFEPLIWILYGLSGYLTGTAGSDYAQQNRPVAPATSIRIPTNPFNVSRPVPSRYSPA